jgi:CHASE2 domain-containing sensor protein
MLSRRTLADWVLLTVVLATLAGMAAWQDWLRRADQVLYDVGLILNTRQPPTDIVIVAIDEESLARIGRWPWRRAVHATLIEKLTEAKAAAVGFDIMLSEADTRDPGGDRILAEAIRRNGRVVLPVSQRNLGPGLISEGLPVEMFANAAARLGHIETELDVDGIARSVFLWAGPGQPKYPQFSLALLQFAQPEISARHARRQPGTEAAPFAWQREGWLHMPFAGPPGTFRTVSYVDVLSGAVPAQALRDKLVLVGATATGLGDIYPTPMSGLGRSMPGVEIHATVLDTLRTGNAIEWLPRERVVAVTVATLFILMLALMHLSPRGGLLISAATALVAVVGSLLLIRWFHIWLPPGPILVATLLAYPLWSWRRLEAAQRFMDTELQQLRESEPATFAAEAQSEGFDPLEHRIAIVRAATERQRTIRKDRDETMRFISHDLRSPLVSVITLVEGANSQTTSDCHARLHQVGLYAQKALDLADDFFRLAKAEAADPRRFSEVDLVSIAMEAADEAWVIAERKKISIVVQNDCIDDTLVFGDRSLLHRALMNLLGNAIKFSPGGSTVRIILRNLDAWLEIAVADDGCGVPDEHQDKLFTRFGRIPSATQQPQPGVGLGLFIVKTIAERHGGRVSVQSAAEKGSTFAIRLPKGSGRCLESDIAPQ